MFTVIVSLTSLIIGFTLGAGARVKPRQPTGFQNAGEEFVTNTLRTNFEPPAYHLLSHITVPLGDGTTQIDHILVSRFGVFVIETKDYSGWIFANATDSKWTQTFYTAKFRFRNPLLQNQLHVRAVRQLLDFLPAEHVRSA